MLEFFMFDASGAETPLGGAHEDQNSILIP
jgi:hypothetical protein